MPSPQALLIVGMLTALAAPGCAWWSAGALPSYAPDGPRENLGSAEPLPSSSQIVSDYQPQSESIWDRMSPSQLRNGVKQAIGQGPHESIARAAFAEGESLFAQKNYREAAVKFKTAAGRWPDTALEEDALFMLGESSPANSPSPATGNKSTTPTPAGPSPPTCWTASARCLTPGVTRSRPTTTCG
jgi:hypothetical protein